DVAEAARPGVAHVGEGVELRDAQDALGDLDPQHLDVARLALAVGAAHEAVGAPLVGGELALLVALDGRDEVVDLRLVREREPRPPEGALPRVRLARAQPVVIARRGHGASLRCGTEPLGRAGAGERRDEKTGTGAERTAVLPSAGARATTPPTTIVPGSASSASASGASRSPARSPVHARSSSHDAPRTIAVGVSADQ